MLGLDFLRKNGNEPVTTQEPSVYLFEALWGLWESKILGTLNDNSSRCFLARKML